MNSDPRMAQVNVGGVSATVRPQRTGYDAIFCSLAKRNTESGLLALGGKWAALVGLRVTGDYGDLCVLSDGVTDTRERKKGEQAFAFPDLGASEAEFAEGFIAWLALPAAVYDALTDAIVRVRRPMNDPALVPPEMLSEEKKENTPTLERESKSA